MSADAASVASGPRDPDFIVIGAMKAGTTTLFEALRAHPDVFMANPKEPNYFSMDAVYQDRGRQWYRELFAGARADQVCGEASPSYTRAPRFPNTAERMAVDLPDVRLVYIMRHPVERFYSNYVFDRSFGFNEPIEQTLSERPYVLETSRYIDQIRRYLDRFPSAQLHCIVLDDLRSDAAGVLSRLADFLGLQEPFPSDSDEPAQANQRGEQHLVRQGNRLLSAARSVPGVGIATKAMPQSAREACRRFVSETLPQSVLGKLTTRRHLSRIQPLTEELRTRLHDLLDPSTTELEGFLGRDLSHWKRAGGGTS